MTKSEKKRNGKVGFIVWTAVSAFLVVLLIVATILTSTAFYDIICIVLGGERADYRLRADAPYAADYDSKKDVLTAA